MTTIDPPLNGKKVQFISEPLGNCGQHLILKSNFSSLCKAGNITALTLDSLSGALPRLIEMTSAFVEKRNGDDIFREIYFYISGSFDKACDACHKEIVRRWNYSTFDRVVNIALLNARMILASHDIPYNARTMAAWAEVFTGKLDLDFINRLKAKLKESE